MCVFGSLSQVSTVRVVYIHSVLVVIASDAIVGATVRLVVSLDVVDPLARRRLKTEKLAMVMSTGYSWSAETVNYSARLLVIVELWQTLDRVDHRILSDLGLKTGRYQRGFRGLSKWSGACCSHSLTKRDIVCLCKPPMVKLQIGCAVGKV